MQRLLEGEPDTFQVLRTNLPRHVPDESAVVPDLLDHPPGRALMTYHPPEGFTHAESGWATETVFFYGRDRKWRRLDLEDLHLPASAWPGPDTYGAGALSPDGRWWAADAGHAGLVLVDLHDGGTRLIDLPGRYVSLYSWIPGERSVVALGSGNGPGSRTYRISVLDRSVHRTPFRAWQVGFEADGTAVSLHGRPGRARLLAWQGSSTVLRGAIPSRLLDGRFTGSVVPTDGRFVVLAAEGGRQDRRHHLVTVSTRDWNPEAALRFDHRRGLVRFLEGWLDPATLLLDTRDHLLAWRPFERRIYRITDYPPEAVNEFRSISVAHRAARRTDGRG